MRSALLVLAMPRCLDASRNATLNVVESLIDLEGKLGYNILMAHVDQLLESLRAIAVTAWSTPVSFPVSFASPQGCMGTTASCQMYPCHQSCHTVVGPFQPSDSASMQWCVICIAWLHRL